MRGGHHTYELHTYIHVHVQTDMHVCTTVAAAMRRLHHTSPPTTRTPTPTRTPTHTRTPQTPTDSDADPDPNPNPMAGTR